MGQTQELRAPILMGHYKPRKIVSQCFTGSQSGKFQQDCPPMDCTMIKTWRGTQVGKRGCTKRFMVPDEVEGKEMGALVDIGRGCMLV